MAADLKDITVQTQDKFLEVLESVQASVLEGVRTWSSSVKSMVPNDLPAPNVPGFDKLPSPTETIDLGFDFVEKVLQAQKSFAEKIVAETASAAPASKSASGTTPIRK